MSEIPTWAIEKALKPFLDRTPTAPWTAETVKAEMDRPHGAHGFASMVLAYAKLIAEHEEPPVDPLLVEAREMVAEDHRTGVVDLVLDGVICKHGGAHGAILRGQFDHRREVQNYLRALRRGIEIGKQS
jgi:hypothetical protein